MQCKCIKKDGAQCTFQAKIGDYCGRHQGCTTPAAEPAAKPAQKGLKIKKKSPLKTFKRFPATKVTEFIKKQKGKLDMEKMTLRKLRTKAEQTLGVDLTTDPNFRARFKELTIQYLA